MERNGIPYRALGRSEEYVSAIGIGGHHLGLAEDTAAAVEIVRTALEAGVNFLDNSWDYHDGESERRMGAALADGYRESAFVMTKLDGRSYEGARRQLDESMARLGVDQLDLVQIHEVIRESDAERVFEPGGAIEALIEARDDGRVRYIGFTGHKDPAVHLKMLYTALDHDLVFDTVQMPINAMDVHHRSFRDLVIPVCEQHGIAVLGMKPIGAGQFLNSGAGTAKEYLRWALTQPVTTVITGCERREIVEQAIAIARDFEPLTLDEQHDLEARTRAAGATDGRYEIYKTGTMFDATAYSPEWLD